MGYENTSVAVTKSQSKLRELLLKNKGSGVAFVSQPPQEGFQAMVPMDGKMYTIRIAAICKEKGSQSAKDQEERRVWRVLFFHMKGIFEAAASGVLEFREMILPYIVTADGKTVGEHLLPNLEKSLAGKPERLLPSGNSD